MADCPGVLHLAAMADGSLARLRVPGGRLAADQLRAIAAAADALGSGIVDLTNRANLQIRGLAAAAGPELAERLASAGLFVDGPADRRRNILLDPFSGLDPSEVHDLRPLAAELDRALAAAPWIGALSPKFSFVLDGGGAAALRGVASDVTLLAGQAGLLISANGVAARFQGDREALAALLGLAEGAAARGEDARARDLDPDRLRAVFSSVETASLTEPPAEARLRPVFGAAPGRGGRQAVALPVAVGRLDSRTLEGAAELAETFGGGVVALAPWSAIVIAGVAAREVAAVLTRSKTFGFMDVAVAARLQVAACAGAPACERAREPAKALALELLAAAERAPERLPGTPRRVHFSACAKGCAGSAPADLLLLGASDEAGWSLHREASPRAPGATSGRLAAPDAHALLDRIAALA